jgi:hypothetical protein
MLVRTGRANPESSGEILGSGLKELGGSQDVCSEIQPVVEQAFHLNMVQEAAAHFSASFTTWPMFSL